LIGNKKLESTGVGDEMEKYASEIKVSRAHNRSLWWSDVICIGNRVWPIGMDQTDEYEKRLRKKGWVPVGSPIFGKTRSTQTWKPEKEVRHET
jgi:hypothetical protein